MNKTCNFVAQPRPGMFLAHRQLVLCPLLGICGPPGSSCSLPFRRESIHQRRRPWRPRFLSPKKPNLQGGTCRHLLLSATIGLLGMVRDGLLRTHILPRRRCTRAGQQLSTILSDTCSLQGSRCGDIHIRPGIRGRTPRLRETRFQLGMRSDRHNRKDRSTLVRTRDMPQCQHQRGCSSL